MDLTRNLRVDSVLRLNPTPPKVIDIGSTVADAVNLMRQEKVGCLLVTRAGELAGIFTERDLLKRVLAVGKPLSDPLTDVITEHPVSVLNKDSIRSAVMKMQGGGYRHLPVVDDANRPAGVISTTSKLRLVGVPRRRKATPRSALLARSRTAKA